MFYSSGGKIGKNVKGKNWKENVGKPIGWRRPKAQLRLASA